MLSPTKGPQDAETYGQPADQRVTAEIGREICQRNGVKAMLTGSVADLRQPSTSITLEAVNASTGDSLAQEQERASGKEQVLDTLDNATTKLREKLGESLASIQKFDKPFDQATTSSLEALKSYTLGDVKHAAADEVGAIPFFEERLRNWTRILPWLMPG